MVTGKQPDRAPALLDRTFKLSIVLKGLDGVLESIGGVLLLVVSPATIQTLAATLTQHELSKDPHDFVATHLLRSAHDLSRGTTVFAAVYLLSHGVAKVVLVIALLRDQTWAYPGMIALLGAFIVYQCYRLVLQPTAGLLALTLFDVFVVVLTWREYRARHGSHGRKGRERVAP